MDKHLEVQYLLMNLSQHPTQDCKSYFKFTATVIMVSAYEYRDITPIEIPGGGIVLPRDADMNSMTLLLRDEFLRCTYYASLTLNALFN
jgi:hypothetical protein